MPPHVIVTVNAGPCLMSSREGKLMHVCRAKCPEKAAEAMRLAAEAAIKEQTRLAQSEIESDMAKREALEALADKEVKLTQSRSLINQLKDLCRELQHQSQQVLSLDEQAQEYITYPCRVTEQCTAVCKRQREN